MNSQKPKTKLGAHELFTLSNKRKIMEGILKWIIQLVVAGIVLIIASKSMSTVEVKSNSTAFKVALVVGIISVLVTLMLNLLTLGIFYFLGLGIITRTLAYAIVLEITDQFTKNFNTKGVLPSLWLAIFISVAGLLVDWIFF